ncbi:MAG: hypothetical protein ACKO5A_05420 [Actinomycetota bacterium]
MLRDRTSPPGDLRPAHPLARAPSVSPSAEFAAAVRVVLEVARRRRLTVPVFRSPPGLPEVDRSIRRTAAATVVSIRLGDRPVASIHADVVDGVIVANRLSGRDAAGFRRAAWAALGGSSGPPVLRPTAAPARPAPVRSSPEVTPGSSSDARVA